MKGSVRIHYRRLPEREDVFEQAVVEDAGEYVVTFVPAVALDKPVKVAGQPVLVPGAPVIWFTYPGRWYDIGLFHLADGTPTGLYANVLTPVVIEADRWETTDLCLDLWRGPDGGVALLDEDEFEEAVAAGWMDGALAAEARRQASSLLAAADAGTWPPAHVAEWSLERARAALARQPAD